MILCLPKRAILCVNTTQLRAFAASQVPLFTKKFKTKNNNTYIQNLSKRIFIYKKENKFLKVQRLNLKWAHKNFKPITGIEAKTDTRFDPTRSPPSLLCIGTGYPILNNTWHFLEKIFKYKKNNFKTI